MNIIQVIGNLGRDPEARYTPSGKKVTTLTIASNSRRSGKDETTWYRITLWGDTFDNILPHLKKGSFLMVIGELRVDSYTSREGEKRFSLEVTADSVRFLPGKSSERSQEGSGDSASSFTRQATQQHSSSFGDMDEMAAVGQGSSMGDDQGDSENDVPF